MTGEARVPFQLVGEVSQERLAELVAFMGGLGVEIKSGTELEPVSPSILIEYLDGVNGLPVPAVTEETVEEFFIAEGGDERGSKTNAHQFMWTLRQHTTHTHDHGGGLSYYGKPAEGCDCPLRIVQYRSPHGSHEIFVGGVDPQSIVGFAELPFEEARRVKGLGAKRYDQVQRVAHRLREDMAE